MQKSHRVENGQTIGNRRRTGNVLLLLQNQRYETGMEINKKNFKNGIHLLNTVRGDCVVNLISNRREDEIETILDRIPSSSSRKNIDFYGSHKQNNSIRFYIFELTIEVSPSNSGKTF